MLEEPLVLDGHRRMDQVLWQLVKGSILLAGTGIHDPQQLDIVVGVHIVEPGGSVRYLRGQIDARSGDNVLLQVVAGGIGQHHKADHADDGHGSRSAHRYLKRSEKHHPEAPEGL